MRVTPTPERPRNEISRWRCWLRRVRIWSRRGEKHGCLLQLWQRRMWPLWPMQTILTTTAAWLQGGAKMNYVFIFPIIFILCCVYLLIRTQWVYKKRTAILDRNKDQIAARIPDITTEQLQRNIEILRSNIQEHSSLPSFDEMTFRYFWIWDIDKLKMVHKRCRIRNENPACG